MDEVQRSGLADRFLRHAEKDARWLKLRAKLLRVGGIEVVAMREPHMRQLLSRARTMTPREVVFTEQVRGACHENTVILHYSSGGEIDVVRGWVLGDDDLWYQHSWGKRGSTVFETTPVPRKRYWGYVMTPREVAAFRRVVCPYALPPR